MPHHYDETNPGSVIAILDPAHTEGEMHEVGGTVPPLAPLLILSEEITERKELEAQIQLKGNGSTWTSPPKCCFLCLLTLMVKVYFHQIHLRSFYYG